MMGSATLCDRRVHNKQQTQPQAVRSGFIARGQELVVVAFAACCSAHHAEGDGLAEPWEFYEGHKVTRRGSCIRGKEERRTAAHSTTTKKRVHIPRV